MKCGDTSIIQKKGLKKNQQGGNFVTPQGVTKGSSRSFGGGGGKGGRGGPV